MRVQPVRRLLPLSPTNQFRSESEQRELRRAIDRSSRAGLARVLRSLPLSPARDDVDAARSQAANEAATAQSPTDRSRSRLVVVPSRLLRQFPRTSAAARRSKTVTLSTEQDHVVHVRTPDHIASALRQSYSTKPNAPIDQVEESRQPDADHLGTRANRDLARALPYLMHRANGRRIHARLLILLQAMQR
ncbi:hypothetical protein [Actimicrobium sp. GrIS 1.19]|uniref:hypothetical protein n=1 Tax=Actimicrobium sp. GrIS 1.19 TaxID=3071708 RepID=UPI002E10C455